MPPEDPEASKTGPPTNGDRPNTSRLPRCGTAVTSPAQRREPTLNPCHLSPARMLDCLLGGDQLFVRVGDDAETGRQLTAALRRFTAFGDDTTAARVGLMLALINARAGRHGFAAERLDQACQVLGRPGSAADRADVLLVQAEVAELAGNHDQARACHAAALELLRHHDEAPDEGRQPWTAPIVRDDKTYRTTARPVTSESDERNAMTHDQTTSGTANEPWWIVHERHYLKGLVEYGKVESRATAVRQFQPFVIPALLQEPGYAEALLRQYADAYPAEFIERTLEVRATRRAAFLSSDTKASFVLDASVLRRPVGSDAIMRQQLAWLHELDSSGRASIKVMDGVYDGMEDHFSLFDVDGQVVAFADAGKGIKQVEDDDRKSELVALFGRFQKHAAPLRDRSS
jgi:hypothetical protein